MHIDYGRAREIKPLIIDLLKKEGFYITVDNIKVWGTPKMSYPNVKIGCDYVKSECLSPVLVYTNEVPHKSQIEEREGVKIFDINDLSILAFRHDSELSKYC